MRRVGQWKLTEVESFRGNVVYLIHIACRHTLLGKTGIYN